MMNFLSFWSTVVVASLSLACVVLTKLRSHNRLPPGPTADPIIGHLRKIPSVNQPEAFHEWAKKYGDVMYLEVLGRKMIILDTLQAATDLLEKRGAIYNCRPNLVVFNMMGWDRSLGTLQYGKRFLLHRKLFENYFGRQESLLFNPILYEESITMVKNLMDCPADYDKIIGQYTARIVVKIAYGYSINDNDPLTDLIHKVGEMIQNSGSLGNTPVDFFPWLAHFPSWFPGTYYATYARKWRSLVHEFINYPFNFTTKQLSEGKAEPSFLSKYLSDLSETDSNSGDQEDYTEEIKNAAAQIFVAGAETSWGALVVFLMAMALHPECQAKAQAQIDAVCGGDRLPTFEDRESLPYIDYIMWEVLRWHPAVPLGLPHRSLKDDVYNGMFIPQGSIVFANIRGIGWDEHIYEDAKTFNPDRFIPKSQGGREEPYLSPFGFGRRICPGRFLAESTLWIAMVMILTTSTIGKAKDANGVEITPEVDFNIGATNHLKPFKFTLSSRTAKASALVEEEQR